MATEFLPLHFNYRLMYGIASELLNKTLSSFLSYCSCCALVTCVATFHFTHALMFKGIYHLKSQTCVLIIGWNSSILSPIFYTISYAPLLNLYNLYTMESSFSTMNWGVVWTPVRTVENESVTWFCRILLYSYSGTHTQRHMSNPSYYVTSESR